MSHTPNLTRREYLRTMSAAGLAALVMNEPRFARGADQIDKPPAKADACILLWMAGGMASPETFDPKRYTPYEVGTPSDKILCTFPAIDTAVDNRNPAIPAFINIGQRLEGVGESEELKAFTTAGFFGSEFGPFNIPFPDDAIAAVQPPKGMTAERFAKREKLLRETIKRGPLGEKMSDYHQESMVRAIDNAHRLLNSPERVAFDLSKEPKESYDKYNTGHFGRGCLLARRLVEAGARFVEVTTEYVPFVHWDTHENGHETVARLKKEIDGPIAQLILDLEARGQLDRTLVVLASEFSRDMMVEGVPGSVARDQSRAKSDTLQKPIHYGLHRHFTGSGSVLMFGGGTKKGFLYGETADERPLVVTKNPVTISNLHATMMTALGISPKTAFTVEQRPFYVTEDGHGKAVTELFAS